jgi:hypothetical protein
MKLRFLVAGLSLLALAVPALAQSNLERFERQLQQIQQDTRLHVNPDVPADQRAFFDYGGYFTFNYLSADDSQKENHVLRQYDLVGRMLCCSGVK